MRRGCTGGMIICGTTILLRRHSPRRSLKLVVANKAKSRLNLRAGPQRGRDRNLGVSKIRLQCSGQLYFHVSCCCLRLLVLRNFHFPTTRESPFCSSSLFFALGGAFLYFLSFPPELTQLVMVSPNFRLVFNREGLGTQSKTETERPVATGDAS